MGRKLRAGVYVSVIVVLVVSVLYFSTSAPRVPKVIRIMPLGDSITSGSGSPKYVGYRQKLYSSLVADGFRVDFVGSLCSNNVTPAFDIDHEGHGGYLAGQIRDNVYGWLSLNEADVILLHIGTNDVGDGVEDAEGVAGILDEVDCYENDHGVAVWVIVARIVLRTDSVALNESTRRFNDSVEIMVEQRMEQGDRVVVVDMESALQYPSDMADGKHPNLAGYEKMASVWLDAIRGIEEIARTKALP